jgi:hypothetical protein
VIEAHTKLFQYFQSNGKELPREMVVIIISLDKKDNTVAATMCGELDSANAQIGLGVVEKYLKSK